ncbi:MAG TPA: VIT1/CCC1 transporter family protein [Spirochaetia bacterium]|nr:VIT1/CCC1 transporter family protein [Spirochaetia bacterium]
MDIESLRKHWQDEGESAFIYRVIAGRQESGERGAIFNRLAEVEEHHQQVYRQMIEEKGGAVGEWKPGLRVRMMKWLVERGQYGLVMSLRISDETREVRTYLQRRKVHPNDDESGEFKKIAREEAHHAQVLGQLTESGAEPWHQSNSGDFLRNVIYGFNDGLTANFGLVMGVLGGNVAPGTLVLTGLSGMVADALSMGGSGFLAAKSEQEVWENEIAMEREEIELMPETEMQELALLYQAKGMPAEAARQAAAQIMSDPEMAVQEKAREELGISPETTPPMKEAITTGIATAIGAIIPVVPFFFGTGPAIIWIAFGISMVAHFIVGAARSLFTGRGIIRSGFDMFVVGLGVAGVGYLVGSLIAGRL